MLPRVVVLCFWILVSLVILQAAPDNTKEELLAICDDTYRSKYIVTKSLFQGLKNTNLNTNLNQILENKHNRVQEDEDDDSNEESKEANNVITKNDKHHKHAHKDLDDDNSEENGDCEPCPHQELASRRSIIGKQLTTDEMENYKVTSGKSSSSKRPFHISIKTEIGINLDDHNNGEIQVIEPQVRRKREVQEEWEGQVICRPRRRVIGGTVAKNIEEIPYMVFVDSGCGGSLISDSWVLTASHCIDSPDDPNYVYAGSLKLTGGCKHKIKEIVKHPKFDSKKYTNDIALLKLYEPFIFSPAIRPITLSMESPKPGECGTITGWGTAILNGTLEFDLKTTTLPVVHSKHCKMFRHIGEGQFCAGFRDAQTDTCQGDSGGPFVINNTLVGIVSYGFKCAVPETPGVYVDVAHHRKWIESVAGV